MIEHMQADTATFLNATLRHCRLLGNQRMLPLQSTDSAMLGCSDFLLCLLCHIEFGNTCFESVLYVDTNRYLQILPLYRLEQAYTPD